MNLPPKLMYKRPGASEHENITLVLDDILLTLQDLTERITVMEEWCYDVQKLNEVYD